MLFMACMLKSVRSCNFVQEIDGFGHAFGNLVSRVHGTVLGRSACRLDLFRSHTCAQFVTRCPMASFVCQT